MKKALRELLTWVKENQAFAGTVFTVLVGPAIVAAGTASKEAWDAWVVADVPWGQSSHAMQQKRLWEVNMPCVQTTEFTTITNKQDVEIGTIICPSGDILISAKSPIDQYPSFKWVSWDSESGSISMEISLDLFSKAYAQQQVASYYEDGYLIQVLRYPDGHCVKFWINPYNGVVIQSMAVRC